MIWQQIYNGPGNNDDAPTGIELNASGDVFVTGTSYGIGTSTDYATLKLNGNTGTILWTKRYNFNNNPEVATDIAVDNAGNIIVCGASANNMLNSDFCILKYNSSGTLLFTRRHATVGNGYDLPTEMVISPSNNVFIVGSANNGNAKDIKLLALNSSLTVSWVQYINHNNREDQGLGIALDAANQIVITGFGFKIGGGADIIVRKYNAALGTQIWNIVKAAPILTDIAKGKKVKTDLLGNIYVAAESEINGTRDFVTMSYTPTGVLRWEKIFNNPNNGNDFAEQIIVASDKVYVTGTNKVGATSKTTTVKYSTMEVPDGFVTDANGTPLYKSDELIIAFNPSVVDSAFVDNKQLGFGIIDDVVDYNTLIAMEEKTGIDFQGGKIYAIKIFPEMTQGDSLSISRLGDIVHIPKFWSYLRVRLPSGTNLMATKDSLNTLDTLIVFSEPNYICLSDGVPNDDFWSNQLGCFSSVYPDNHINAPDAWDIEVGKNTVKVGVIDNGINYSHPDFSIDGSLTFGGSKIAGGKFYGYSGTPLVQNFSSTNPNPNGHGTKVAGVIGAIRNNETSSVGGNSGVAGIAGGNLDSNNNAGVALYDLNVETPDGGVWINYIGSIANAIVQGATSTNNGGYGLHIINMSNGTNALSNLLKDTWSYAKLHEVCMVASRGNYVSATAPGNNTALHYPGCLSDPWVINVGANNLNGTRKVWGDGVVDAEKHFESYYDNGVDVIAPGGLIIQTYTTSIDSTYSPIYEYFYQTSASTAYVSGFAGLMMSQQNGSQLNDPQNLALEDIEHLIQNYADSVTEDGVGGSGLSVPNIYAGWGKLNAEKVMQKLDYPMWQVYHSGTPTFETVISATYNTQVIFNNHISELSLAAATYFVDRYKVQQTYIITFPPSVTVVDNWLRVNPSGFSGANPNNGERWCNYSYSINASNQVTVVMETFSYKILTTTGGSVIDEWVPFPADEVITRFSLLLYDPNNTSIEDIPTDNSNWALYPNPATNQITLAMSFQDGSDGQWTVVDLYGRSILNGRLENLSEGVNYLTIPVESLASGIYFCNLVVDGKSSTKKFIVQ